MLPIPPEIFFITQKINSISPGMVFISSGMVFISGEKNFFPAGIFFIPSGMVFISGEMVFISPVNFTSSYPENTHCNEQIN